MGAKSNTKVYSLCVSEIGADYDIPRDSADDVFIPLNSIGNGDIYYDDIVKDLPDLTFYERERDGANPEG